MTQQTYKGGCHCGAVRFETNADLSGNILACNCSICAKQGLWLTFVPAEDFKLESGEQDLADYTFNKGSIHHRFCRKCGVESFGTGMQPDGKAMVAVNVRCLDGVDISTLTVTPFDGKSL